MTKQDSKIVKSYMPYNLEDNMARTKRGVISRAKHGKVLKSVRVKEAEGKILYELARSDGKSYAICV